MKRIIAISICLVFVLSASTIPLAQEKVKKRMTFEEFYKKVLNEVNERNEKLVHLFNQGKYQEMAAEFSAYSTITTHKKNKIPAKDSAEYWESLGEMEAADLRFELKSHYGWVLKLREPPCPHETDFVIVEITKFSFTGGSEGEEGSTRRHRVMCEDD